MSEKGFTMTSNQYCGSCGSFDLVSYSPNWISRYMLNSQSRIYCYGCDKKFSDRIFADNAIRTVPLTFNDFFFQTCIKTSYLKKKQIKPLTHFFGLSLIASTVAVLLLFDLPRQQRGAGSAQIEWVTRFTALTETDVLKDLQHKFDQLVQAK